MSRKSDGLEKADRRKYGNVKIEEDGKTFDSIKEAKYYGQLKLRKAAGEIKDFEHHVVYQIELNEQKIFKYEADFVVQYHDGTQTIIDVKSKATATLPVFNLKKRIIKAIYNVDIIVIK
jgi:hypothetical protein